MAFGRRTKEAQVKREREQERLEMREQLRVGRSAIDGPDAGAAQMRPESSAGEPPPGRATALFTRPNMLLLLLGSFAAFLNLHVAFSVLPLYVLEVGGSEFDAGWQSALFALAAVILRLYLGPLADSRGRKLPLIIGSFIFFTSPLAFLYSDSVATLAIARVYQAGGLAAYLGAAFSYATDLSPAARRGLALGALSFVSQFALMSGPPLAVEIIQSYGFRMLFWGTAVLGFAGFVGILLIREPRWTGGGSTRPRLSDMTELFAARPVRVALIVATVVGLAYGGILTFLPIYATQVGIANYGLYFTILAGCGVSTGMVSGWLSDRYGRLPVVIPALLLFGTGVALLAWITSPVIYLLSALLAGVGFTGTFMVLAAWIVDSVSVRRRGLALANRENAIDLGIAVGAFLFGALAIRLTYPLTFLLAGAVCAALSVWLFFQSRSIRSSPSLPDSNRESNSVGS